MKGYKLFLSWLSTVIFGSITIAPVAGFYMYSFENDQIGVPEFESYFLVSVIAAIISALFSLPTMAVIIIRNAIIKKTTSLARRFLKLNVTHLFMALLTIAVFSIIILIIEYQSYQTMSSYPMNVGTTGKPVFSPDLSPVYYFSLVVLWYFLCSLPIWFLFFRKEIKQIQQERSLKRNEVLDEAANNNIIS